MECPHAILGVSKDCSLQELKKAYKLKVKQTHPDITGKSTDSEFVQIYDAYLKILSAPPAADGFAGPPYLTVCLSAAAGIKCRCGSTYTGTAQIGAVECSCCSHYIEIVPDC